MQGNVILNKGTGIAHLGDVPLYEVTDANVVISLRTLDILMQNGSYMPPTGQDFNGRVELSGFNLDNLATLTGGTVATGSTRVKEETLTKATTTITLSETPTGGNVVIYPVASNTNPLKKVTSSPDVGEYSISGTTVTIHASEPADDFECKYYYEDAVNGEKLTIDPSDLPDNFSLTLAFPADEYYSKGSGFIVVEISTAQRTGDIELGGAAESNKNFGFDFHAVNAVPGDVTMSVDANV